MWCWLPVCRIACFCLWVKIVIFIIQQANFSELSFWKIRRAVDICSCIYCNIFVYCLIMHLYEFWGIFYFLSKICTYNSDVIFDRKKTIEVNIIWSEEDKYEFNLLWLTQKDASFLFSVSLGFTLIFWSLVYHMINIWLNQLGL